MDARVRGGEDMSDLILLLQAIMDQMPPEEEEIVREYYTDIGGEG